MLSKESGRIGREYVPFLSPKGRACPTIPLPLSKDGFCRASLFGGRATGNQKKSDHNQGVEKLLGIPRTETRAQRAES